MGPDLKGACLGLGSDHAQFLLLKSLRHAKLLDVATWKLIKMEVSDSIRVHDFLVYSLTIYLSSYMCSLCSCHVDNIHVLCVL